MNKEALLKRLEEIKKEFDEGEALRQSYVKSLSSIETKQLQLQGAYAEVERQLKELTEEKDNEN